MSSASHAWLDRDVTTRAYAWRLDRDDGVSLGFISHDKDVIINDFRYRAAPGMIPSTIALSDSLDIDSIEIEGVLSNSAIAETDLAAGRWNGAQLRISLVNWEYPDQTPLELISGEFGEICQSGDAFRVEILGPTSFLDEAIAPLTSPTCRARFGDRHCKKSLFAHQTELAVTAIDGDMITFDGLGGFAADYIFGELRWLSGENCGLRFAIFSGEGDTIGLVDAPRHNISLGDRALLTAGCDKNFSTCRDRFTNSINFRGEPYLPGNDLLTRYPGA